MRPTAFALVLLTAAAAAAQTPPPPPTHAVVTTDTFRSQIAPTFGCPVGFTASKQGSPAAIWTTSLEDAQRPANELKSLHSGVHVNLNARHRVIQQADFEVFFVPAGTRLLPVAGSQFAPSSTPGSEASKNFSLVGESASHHMDGDLLLGPVATITHVSLMHVIYTDGTEWKAPGSAACSVKMSLYMPVNAK